MTRRLDRTRDAAILRAVADLSDQAEIVTRRYTLTQPELVHVLALVLEQRTSAALGDVEATMEPTGFITTGGASDA